MEVLANLIDFRIVYIIKLFADVRVPVQTIDNDLKARRGYYITTLYILFSKHILLRKLPYT